MHEPRGRWLWVAVGGWLGGLTCYAAGAYGFMMMAGLAMSPGSVGDAIQWATALTWGGLILGLLLEFAAFVAAAIRIGVVLRADLGARTLLAPAALALGSGLCAAPPLIGLLVVGLG